MCYIILLILLFLPPSVTIPAESGRNSHTACQQPKATPQIDFDQQIRDLGQLSRSKGKKQKCRFTFTNTGEAPLVVEQVETTCGCTSATYTRKPVAPGHQGHVTITFDPSSQSPGLFRKGITVYANTPGGFTRLFIKGEVIDNE